jgi:hypothetical protein
MKNYLASKNFIFSVLNLICFNNLMGSVSLFFFFVKAVILNTKLSFKRLEIGFIRFQI